MKLGSLFDGSGTFPFAAELDGIEPVWASEIEPFPVLVTHTRFPYMKHLGDVTKINGAEIEPVDILTFGSPCQDLSVAGAQKGLQDGERSSLFFEAIRIIKEMRQATNGKYPRVIIFENVPGIFSSQKGRDFHEVLKQFVSIVDGADVPRPTEKNGRFVWRRNGCILGGGYSFAWRQLDAQFFGVPQRRKRVFIVGCLDSERAADILFNANGLPRDFAQSERARQRASADTGRGVDGTDQVVSDCYPQIARLTARADSSPCIDRGQPFVCYDKHTTDGTDEEIPPVCIGFKGKAAPKAGIACSEQLCPTLISSPGVPTVCIGIDRAAYNQGKNAQYKPQFNDNLQPSLTAKGPGAVCYGICSYASNAMKSNNPHSGVYEATTARTLDENGGNPSCNQGGVAICETVYAIGNGQADQTGLHDKCGIVVRYIVRRLMPVECARLMGFPNWYCNRLAVENPTEKDMEFWRRVFETYANATGGKMKSDKQIRKWLADPMSDSAQYKMWGNGIALPVARYIVHACKEALNGQE